MDTRKLPTFLDWMTINTICKAELDGCDIRTMQKEDMANNKNPLWKNLAMNFKESFLMMSNKDEQTLDRYKYYYKLHS